MTDSRPLRVTEALPKDVGHGFARVGPEDLARLGLGVGDTIEVEGKRITMCRVMLAYEDVRGQSRVQLDGITRDNARVGLDDDAMLRRRGCAHARNRLRSRPSTSGRPGGTSGTWRPSSTGCPSSRATGYGWLSSGAVRRSSR